MKKFFKNFITVITVLFLNILGLVAHVSAMPAYMHGMEYMNHTTISSVNCISLCKTAVLKREETLALLLRDDDEPVTPFYVQFQSKLSIADDNLHKLTPAFTYNLHKVPIYILYGVLRT